MERTDLTGDRLHFLGTNFVSHDSGGVRVWAAGSPCPVHILILAFSEVSDFRVELQGPLVRLFIAGAWHSVPVTQCTPQAVGFLGDYLKGQQDLALASLVGMVNQRLGLHHGEEMEGQDAHPKIH